LWVILTNIFRVLIEDLLSFNYVFIEEKDKKLKLGERRKEKNEWA